MTLLEYLISIDKNKIIQSDGFSQGLYIDASEIWKLDYEKQFTAVMYPFLRECIGYPFCIPRNDRENVQYIDGKALEFIRKTVLIKDKEVENYRSDTRRPYFRLRGKKVTEQQAFEIIGRTDEFFYSEVESEKSIHLQHIPNWWFSRNHHPTHYGWCHPSGIVGCDGITAIRPDIDELLGDMVELKYAFPYLDFVMAITDWNEVPPEMYVWREKVGYNIEEWRKLYYMEFDGFLDHVEIGIWIHDNAIEFMEPGRARAKYEEYDAKYSEPNKDIYVSEYYQDHNIFTADLDYLRRCIEAHGLDPDNVLAGIREYIWKERPGGQS